MRLTDHVSSLVETALANQLNPGEVVDHEVMMASVSIPGGRRPELTIQLVGYDGTTPLNAAPVTIAGPTTTQAAVDGHVATALTWIRAQ
ncbi:hypothetical protein [Streptosporangium sp. NPDC048865]|uniref:hypothetical protein n=1 Tax=Streptosporangium sp. NPDC048865 TaxID=3155766 RepID=UPI00342A1BD4